MYGEVYNNLLPLSYTQIVQKNLVGLYHYMLLIKVLKFYDLLELRNILTTTFKTLTKAIFLFCENAPVTVLKPNWKT